MQTLNEIADAVHANAVEKGFHPQDQVIEDFVSNQCNNMHGEVQELWDAWRAGEADLFCDKAAKMRGLGLRPLTCKEEELADLVIRALDVSRRLGINILEAIQIKHEYNRTRPYKHGKRN